MAGGGMTRENAATKARRLLTEGRLRVTAANAKEPFLAASVRGDSGAIYDVGFEPDGGWWCSCEARSRCSHVLALQLLFVTDERTAA
jgi:hypothetical protein